MRCIQVLLFAITLCTADESADRQKEAKSLARQGSTAIPRLSELIFDEAPAVRAQAVKSLVSIGGQGSLDPLTRSVADGDPQIQIAAINGLVNFYLPGFVQSGVSASLKHTGTKVISKFAGPEEQLIPSFIVPRPEVIGVLAKQIADAKDMSVRAAAARAAGVLRGRGAVEALTAALRSKDDALLFESVTALEKIRDPRSAPSLVILFRDPKEKIQVAALEAAGLLMNHSLIPDLEKTLLLPQSPKAKRAAIGALGQLKSESSRPIFEKHLEDKDDGIRAAAAEALGRLASPADSKRIEALFNDEGKMQPRLAQAFALVAQGDHQFEEFSPLRYLTNSLNSKAWGGIAEAYVTELVRQPAVLNAIYSTIPSSPKDEKIRFARALSKSGDKSSIEKIEGLTKDANAEVAEESVRALRVLKARLP